MALTSITVPSGLARLADHIGRKREEFNVRRGSRSNNAPTKTLAWSLERNITGARGEAALYWAFGGFFGGAVWDKYSERSSWKNVPDIIFRGVNYDAKGIDRNTFSLVVPPDLVHSPWIYVLVGTQFWPEAELLGWCSGADILTSVPEERVPGRPAYFIKQKNAMMRSCMELPYATPEERIAEFFSYLPQDPDERDDAGASDDGANL